MSYITFNRLTGEIETASYAKPKILSDWIQVEEKVINEFLTGKVQTNRYRVKYIPISKNYQLVTAEDYPKKEPDPILTIDDVRAVEEIVKLRIAEFYRYGKKFPKLIFEMRHIRIINFSHKVPVIPKRYFVSLYWFLSSCIKVFIRKSLEKSKIVANKVWRFVLDCVNPYKPIKWLDRIFGVSTIVPGEVANLCIAPWVHIHTWPNNNVYPCCMTPMEHTVGDLSKNTLTEIFNGEAMSDLRLALRNNIRPESCQRCYSIEDSGGQSFRNHMNNTFYEHFDLVNKTDVTGKLKDMQLHYWDFRFSNICNFRCRTCGPHLSTGWYEDQKELWGKLDEDVPDPTTIINIWEQVEPMFEYVEDIYFAGGEPLLMEEHYRILKRLDELGKYDVRLRYNTNFSSLRYKKLDVLDIWPKFDSVSIGASIDAYGEQAEYIRKGTAWDVIVDNRNKMKIKAPNAEFYVNCTLSVLNAHHIVDFFHWAIENEFIPYARSFHINLVHHPEHFSIQALPDRMKSVITKKYENVERYLSEMKFTKAAENWRMAINFMNEKSTYNKQVSSFQETINSVDKIRNESLKKTLPELSEML